MKTLNETLRLKEDMDQYNHLNNFYDETFEWIFQYCSKNKIEETCKPWINEKILGCNFGWKSIMRRNH